MRVFTIRNNGLVPAVHHSFSRRHTAIAAPPVCPKSLCVAAFLDRDKDREQGRKYRRIVFDAERWKQHRSSQRYMRHIKGIFTSRIVRGLLRPMLYVASISLLVCLYHTLLEFNILQQLAPCLRWPLLAMHSSGIFSISTFALSLLLVFRTNSSYERWWEARSCWTKVVSECTHLANQVQQLAGMVQPTAAAAQQQDHRQQQWQQQEQQQQQQQQRALWAALLRWLRAFPISLKAHLRRPDGKLHELSHGVLWPDESSLLLQSPHPPNTVLTVLGQLIAACDVRVEVKVHMYESVRVLQAAAGNCDQILTTPLPVSYTRHTSRFLVLWLTCLPFVIWQDLRWCSVFISALMSFLLLAIDEIGLQIEEPFGILPLDAYCEEVDAAVSQAAADAQAAHKHIQQLLGSSTAAAAAAAAVMEQVDPMQHHLQPTPQQG